MSTDQWPRMDTAAVVTQDSSSTTVLNPISGRIFVINDVGKRILELSDGTRTIDQIAAEITTEFHGAQVSETLRDVGEFLEGCVDASLVVMEKSYVDA